MKEGPVKKLKEEMQCHDQISGNMEKPLNYSQHQNEIDKEFGFSVFVYGLGRGRWKNHIKWIPTYL